MKKYSKTDLCYYISTSIVFLIVALCCVEFYQSYQISKSSPGSISSHNLRNAGESFRLGWAAEGYTGSVSDFSQSESWKEMQGRLSDYANRLELLQDQRRSQHRMVTIAMLAAILGAAGFGYARKADKDLPD